MSWYTHHLQILPNPISTLQVLSKPKTISKQFRNNKSHTKIPHHHNLL
ncbi:hypothetical protein NC651_009134 [Populus alba x Populus x berolinensis]|nr:hypothetical protein NC651_009134 [Populus alba x Populus x berolinensis]